MVVVVDAKGTVGATATVAVGAVVEAVMTVASSGAVQVLVDNPNDGVDDGTDANEVANKGEIIQ
eukprot:CAMPEP_0203686294 /NCGR_PEP_ID=MMETSP0090-20130426/48991_1 /ASSEMBLY_ACC=CAM_ASM_001088 /TAXON_ID=426623 /ORGANISM="Chaetoceros affinis, Strain CCMP159" /LENGTH=63 /DNA_ID=CAMNT_0050555517 /DNA_START=586 /DNA_END=777 /DNA_ORIENTATION=+